MNKLKQYEDKSLQEGDLILTLHYSEGLIIKASEILKLLESCKNYECDISY